VYVPSRRSPIHRTRESPESLFMEFVIFRSSPHTMEHLVKTYGRADRPFQRPSHHLFRMPQPYTGAVSIQLMPASSPHESPR